MKRIYLLSFLILCLFSSKTQAQIYINEWMASNSATISDPDFDDTGDWIELYNSSNQAVDLSGYFLSDNFNEPTKWVFPSNTSISAQNFLLIWADGQNTGLHSSFKLTKEGEEIGLYDRDTLLLDSVLYAFQATDISMGRKTDGASELNFFTNPSPNASNNTQQGYAGLTFNTPLFSIRGGFFTSQIELELSSLVGQIRYTLDGSFPTENATLYTTPIQLNSTTVVRASVFETDFVAGQPVTHSYFFNENFDTRALPVISLSTNPEYFWDPAIGLYVQNFKPDWEYPINIELFENDGSNRAAFSELAGTKVNGENSWALPQKMLGIYFDNEYGNNNLDYPLFFDRPRRKYDNFILRASGSDWASTLFRDALAQSLTVPNMDMHIAGYRPAVAYVNGAYMGIHNLRSRVDESFIEETFGYPKGSFDLIANAGEVEEGDDLEFSAFWSLFNTDLSQQSNFQALESVLDIPNFMDYYITEIYSSNSSWGHNILMWKPKAMGAKWRYLLTDLDRGFTGSYDDYISQFSTANSPSYYSEVRKPLREMLKNQAFSDAFVARFTNHLYTTFHPETVNKAIFKHENAIKAEIPYHVNRWSGTTSNYGNGISTVAFWENQVSALHTFANERPTNLLADMQAQFGLENPVSLGIMSLPIEGGKVEINDISIPASPWVGPYFPNMPIALEAKPSLGYIFNGWRLATNETLIEKESIWKYLDDGSDQNTAWQATNFDDTNWAEGQAELGYGDGGENTTLSFGSNGNDKPITTYFRKEFTIQDISDFTGQVLVNLRRDDGAVLYLNGEELLRSNMPSGSIDAETRALETVQGQGETSFLSFSLPSNQLKNGKNVLAVEVHQISANSSDISFDLELQALKVGQSAVLSFDPLLNLGLDSDTFLIAKFEPTTACFLPAIIESNMTLTTACSPYLVPADVHVLEDVTLTIEAGVELHFAQKTNLLVNGTLNVLGEENARVRFKAAPGVDTWGAVLFKHASGKSTLTWLEMSDASQGVHPIYENAALSAFQSEVHLNHILIENVENNPIIGYYSTISLKNSRLHSKVTGDLINIKYGNGTVENTDFRGNFEIDTDAIDYDEVENGVIRGNKIYDFLGFNSDGIDLGEATKDVVVEDNFIHNCSDKAVSVGQHSSVLAKNNTIVNCAQGFGIKDVSFADIDESTFYNVANPISTFEKNVGQGGGTAFVSNSILSNSPIAALRKDNFSMATFDHCLSDTDSLSGAQNLFGHPHFENPTQHNFHLKSNSLALGAGLDTNGNSIDLGTKSHLFDAPASIQISRISYNPSPNSDAEYIMLHNPSDQSVDLTNYVLSEAIDFIFPMAQIAPQENIIVALDASFFSGASEQVFQWTAGKLSNAGETIRLTDANGIIVDNVRYNDNAPWPIEADGMGAWLELISSDLDNHFAESWEAKMLVQNTNLAEKTTDFYIFPNPSSHTLFINAIDSEIHQVEIINILGKRVYYADFSSKNAVSVDVSGFSSGVYYMRLNGGLNGMPVHVLGL